MNKEIQTIFDSYVDPKFGTGAVKVTPAHDPNDFAMGQRHNLQFINVLTDDAHMNDFVPEKYRGMDRYECRKVLIEDLEKQGYLVKTESHKHAVGECYRCKTTVEPRYSDQWFVRMQELAKPAIEAVKSGKIEFLPKRWIKVYYNWLNNIRDWCISRQLWWGHRIPVYYCKNCGKMVAAPEMPTSCECGEHEFYQDTDVLDTWFSSWLWPFSTLGWPSEDEKTKSDLAKFYPTSTLVTAPDIIFFWVARMIMAGLYFMNDIPFERVFFTGMVMDLQGRKMSKSLGNGIDPFEVIDRHGADALRYTMIAIVSPNQNLKLGFPKEGDTSTLDSFEIGSRFANKIWNAARFILMNVDENFKQVDIANIKSKDIFDKWILDELNHLTRRINSCMDKARFNDVALELQHFFWDMYCDWYLEIVKGRIFSTDQNVKNEALSVAIFVLTQFLKLLHPVMPFITEEIYQKLPQHGLSIMVEDYPEYNAKLNAAKDKAKANKFFDAVRLVRQIRGENAIPPEKKTNILMKTTDEDLITFSQKYGAQMMALCKGSSLTVAADTAKPADAASGANGLCEVYIPLDGIVDKEKEKQRLEKEYAKVKADFDKTNAKLNNANFTAKAPAEIIEKEKAKLEEFKQKLDKLSVMLGK